jgi:hypothetical protein
MDLIDDLLVSQPTNSGWFVIKKICIYTSKANAFIVVKLHTNLATRERNNLLVAACTNSSVISRN